MFFFFHGVHETCIDRVDKIELVAISLLYHAEEMAVENSYAVDRRYAELWKIIGTGS